MKKTVLLALLIGFVHWSSYGQISVNTSQFNKRSGVKLAIAKNKLLSVTWPSGNNHHSRLILDLNQEQPLLKSVQLLKGQLAHEVARDVDPIFWMTVGKRDLISQNAWNIFFDKVHLKPHQSHKVTIHKKDVTVISEGSRTIIRIGETHAADFKGVLEITLYNGASLFNIAAVMATEIDSTAIIYDAGLASKSQIWKQIAYADVYDQIQQIACVMSDTAKSQAVKYRTIMGSNEEGSIAVFPAPHQYFYPLDEAFNLKFTWYGSDYQKVFNGYGIGIRQDLRGDNRFVPWFNAPPKTQQRLNFFCQISDKDAAALLADVKKWTNNDTYVALPGFKTMASHFHNEFVVKVIMANKPLPDTPSFKKVFNAMGVDIVHLGEFHYTAHPKGPDELRLLELKYMFDMCKQYSDKNFLLMPGEEPNEFLGGHWMALFPKPVYWIMSRKPELPMESNHPVYGKIYRIGNAEEMLQLLQKEKGLAWTAHPRTKGSTGFPDKYKESAFFKSDRFMGAAWKALPADLSQDKLGNGRVLDLMDDMNNWGEYKKVIGEADLFTIEPENEMYAHMNINYLQLDTIPDFTNGWQPVLDAMEQGRFFTTTGEVLIPRFTVDEHSSGSHIQLKNPSRAVVVFDIKWTFPLNFAEVITGDGNKVERHKIDLGHTLPFGNTTIRRIMNLAGKKWIRLEVWDAAVNGAFTQTIWLQ